MLEQFGKGMQNMVTYPSELGGSDGRKKDGKTQSRVKQRERGRERESKTERGRERERFFFGRLDFSAAASSKDENKATSKRCLCFSLA